MARIVYPINEDEKLATGKCQVCDEKSTAYWMGGEVGAYEVCGTCALEKLPLLIADAISINPHWSWDQLERAEKEMRLSFWRGLALRLLHENKQLHAKLPPELKASEQQAG